MLMNPKVFFDLLCIIPQSENRKSSIIFLNIRLEALSMEKKTVKELILDLEQELLRLGYTKGSMTFYKSRWRMLLEFAQNKVKLIILSDWASTL